MSSARPLLPRILVVDDHVDTAESICLFLELRGHRVQVAHDGATAVAMARSLVPDLVLCDLDLPGDMDGCAVARAIRTDVGLRAVRLVALTGYSDEDHRQRARDAGFDAHLTKPVDFEALGRQLAL